MDQQNIELHDINPTLNQDEGSVEKNGNSITFNSILKWSSIYA